MVTMVAASRMKVRVVPVTTRLVVLSCRSLWQCKVRSWGEWGLGKHQSTLLLCGTESLFLIIPRMNTVCTSSILFDPQKLYENNSSWQLSWGRYGFVISLYCVTVSILVNYM